MLTTYSVPGTVPSPGKEDEKEDLFIDGLKGQASPIARLAEKVNTPSIVGSRERGRHPGWVSKAVWELRPRL